MPSTRAVRYVTRIVAQRDNAFRDFVGGNTHEVALSNTLNEFLTLYNFNL